MDCVKILDGGLGTELERIGCHIENDPLWSSRLLFSDPESVINIHKIFAKHGSTVAITLTYQASIPGFMEELGIDHNEAVELIGSSVSLAKQGMKSGIDDQFLVAGSVGPYGACKCDRSEYTGDYLTEMTIEDLMNWHRPRIAALAQTDCSILAFETIPGLKEAKALMGVLHEFPNLKAWLSFCCKSHDSIVNGDIFNEAVKEVLSLDVSKQLVAIGVNCCAPEYVSNLLNSTVDILPPYCKHIAYPNSGQTFKDNCYVDESKFKDTFSNAGKWIKELKVDWIGGCCNTTPSDISCLKNAINKEFMN